MMPALASKAVMFRLNIFCPINSTAVTAMAIFSVFPIMLTVKLSSELSLRSARQRIFWSRTDTRRKIPQAEANTADA